MVIRRRTKSRKPQADERGRGALIHLLDRYVEALVVHDPARLPMSPRTRFTENGQQLSLGEGLWGTATGASYPRYVEFVDPGAGQVGFRRRMLGRIACRPIGTRRGISGLRTSFHRFGFWVAPCRDSLRRP
jgi:hypothetical protein